MELRARSLEDVYSTSCIVPSLMLVPTGVHRVHMHFALQSSPGTAVTPAPLVCIDTVHRTHHTQVFVQPFVWGFPL